MSWSVDRRAHRPARNTLGRIVAHLAPTPSTCRCPGRSSLPGRALGLPIAAVRRVLDTPDDAELIECEAIRFFRVAGQSVVEVGGH